MTKKSATHPKTPPRAAAGRDWPLWLAGILAVTFVAFIPMLDNQFTNWDDKPYVTENPLITNPDFGAILRTPIAGNYHPLTIWSLVLNYRLSGFNPVSYHWLSLLLHLANTALTFLLVRRLTGGAKWPAVICAAVFGIHPMHVESVAWIAERKDVLYAFFYLAGLLAYLKHVERPSPKWLAATFVAFALSLASKPAAVVFPVTLLAIDWLKRRPLRGAALLEKLPFFAGSVAVGLWTLGAQKGAGALAQAGVWSPFQKMLLASYGVVMYVVKFFLPFGLSAIYPAPVVGQGFGLEFYLAALALVAAIVAAFVFFKGNRLVQFGLAFFAINVALTAQLFTFGSALMADRYTYLPYIGLALALSSVFAAAGTGAGAGAAAPRQVVRVLFLVLLPLSLYLTWKRCDVWQDSGTLWNDTIQRYPHRIVDAYNLRGYHLEHDLGHYDAALADYNEALALNPTAALVWNHKGSAWTAMGRPDSALVAFDHAIALKPDLADAYNNRGAVRGRLGDMAGAIADFTRAIQSDPRFRGPYVNRSVAYYMVHQNEAAIADTRKAIELDPANPENPTMYDAIGLNLQVMGRAREAVEEHTRALQAAPSDDPRTGGFYMNRSLAWRAAGQPKEALADAMEAGRRGVPLDSNYVKALGGRVR